MRKFLLILLLFSDAVSAQTPLHKLARKKQVSGGVASNFIRVNIYDSASSNLGKYNTFGWNDWSISLANGTTCVANSQYLLWDDGETVSGVRVRIESTGAACPSGAQYVDNQSGESTYGDTETFPNFVKAHMRSAIISTAGTYRMIISGLPDNATNGYKLIILSTRNTTTTRRNTFAVGGTSQQVNAHDNLSTEVVLDNLTPSSNTIQIDITTQDGFGFVAAWILEKYPPAEPEPDPIAFTTWDNFYLKTIFKAT